MTHPLAGLRVLDFTQYEAGTSATQTLAWLGADIVKVEPPGAGEPGRGRSAGPLDRSYFLTLNGNKRSLSLNLKKPAGRELLLRMLPRFHVVTENLGPGTMESLGLGEDELRRLHPSLIYATLKGFGTTGPHAHYRSYDMVAQAVGGSMSITGTSATEPLRSGVTYGDTGTGMQFAIGILAAYTRFLQTGEGGHVEVSMQDAIASYARVGFLARENVGDPVPRVGNNLRQLPPTNTFACKPFGPNDYVYVVANTALMLERLLIAIGQPALVDDPRVATVAARQENEEWLQGLICSWASQLTKFEAMDQLQCAGIPAGAVYDSGDVFNDPHLIERGMIQQVDHPTRGPIEILGNPIRVDRKHSQLTPAPLLGQHTEEILFEELSLAADEVAALRKAGVV